MSVFQRTNERTTNRSSIRRRIGCEPAREPESDDFRRIRRRVLFGFRWSGRGIGKRFAGRGRDLQHPTRLQHPHSTVAISCPPYRMFILTRSIWSSKPMAQRHLPRVKPTAVACSTNHPTGFPTISWTRSWANKIRRDVTLLVVPAAATAVTSITTRSWSRRVEVSERYQEKPQQSRNSVRRDDLDLLFALRHDGQLERANELARRLIAELDQSLSPGTAALLHCQLAGILESQARYLEAADAAEVSRQLITRATQRSGSTAIFRLQVEVLRQAGRLERVLARYLSSELLLKEAMDRIAKDRNVLSSLEPMLLNELGMLYKILGSFR